MHGNSTLENRETPSAPVAEKVAGRLEKAMSQKSNMHVGGESDGCVIPSKCPNKGGQPPAEGMEGRQPTKENKENIGQATASRTQSRIGELSDLLQKFLVFTPAERRTPRLWLATGPTAPDRPNA
jgi:hypothetical protein